MAMKGCVFLFVFLVLGATGVLHADDLLDARLDALKKKVQRRNYSDTAILDEQNLTVPKALTEEEKELDAKIRAMEKEMDTDPSMMRQQVARPRRVRRTDQNDSANWLTPALLDQLSGGEAAPDEEEETSWVQAELARQESLRQEKLTREEEQTLVEQRVQEKIRKDTRSPLAPADDYNQSLQSIISGRTPAEEAPSEWSSRRFLYNRFQRRSSSPDIEELSESSSSIFPSPGSRAQTAGTDAKKTPSFLEQQKLDYQRSPFSTVVQQRADEKEQEPIRRRIHPSTRSRDENPFEKEWVPDMKTSIWD
ncbi:MAG TPA: hypothetical protein VJ904_14880 [Tichowtungia sp.]|nr:hypothetical protein [Tichowtungia sp.]